jgi:hypothetical protein
MNARLALPVTSPPRIRRLAPRRPPRRLDQRRQRLKLTVAEADPVAALQASDLHAQEYGPQTAPRPRRTGEGMAVSSRRNGMPRRAGTGDPQRFFVRVFRVLESVGDADLQAPPRLHVGIGCCRSGSIRRCIERMVERRVVRVQPNAPDSDITKPTLSERRARRAGRARPRGIRRYGRRRKV